MCLATMQGFLWTMMVPTIPLLAKDAGVSEMQLGIITAIPPITTIISCIPGNSLGLRYGKRTLFIWSQGAGLICGLLFYLTRSMSFIVIPQVFYGLSNMLFWPTESAYITEVAMPEKRATAIAYSMAASTIGSILSPLVAGRIIDTAGYRPVFVLYMAMAGVGILVARTFPKLPSDFEGSVVATIMAGYTSVGRMLRRPLIQVATMNTFLTFITVAASESFISAFLRENNYSATFIGVTVTLRTVAMTAVRLFMEPVVKKWGAFRLLFIAVFLCAIGGGLVPVFPIPAYVLVANVLVGAGFGASPPLTSMVLAEHTTPHERGMVMALNNTSTNVGRSTAGIGFGAVAQLVGFGPAIVIANGFVIAGSIFTILRFLRLGGVNRGRQTSA